ncbi:choice-of-anchor U domain-containing protein [Simplicispira psychrophila]|uniref:choice-of-anchor U domain-containing protein n=1 Tax=Simplicispira psychrophila TaxID=80882 RepID=UPI000B2A5DA2|nr:choice-of-anchor U domain-containing protein [Simplicispira psychrophila]
MTFNVPNGQLGNGTIVFTFNSTASGATPTLTSVSPSSGSTAGGTSVTLTGTNLTGATSVQFGGTAATNVTVNSATQITATTPAHAAGAVNVAVTTPGGTATLTNGYTYALPAPTAGAVSATVAANSSANSITLNLSGGAATSVAVSSAASHGTATASGTSITYTPTAGYSGSDSFTYTATNAGGTSAAATVTLTVSAPVLAVSPATLGGGTVGVAYSATVSASGGAAPYSYAITPGSLPAGLSLNASSGVISGTPTASGTSNFTVTATDANSATGARAYSVAMAVPITAPGAPTGVSATAGDTQASVIFTSPVSNGGATITGYTVTSSPGGLTGTGTSSPITVTGLSNGTAYTFTVTATNSAGTGGASGVSNAVTPKASQIITFNNPGAQNFGTTPTLTATASSGLTPTFTSATTGVCTITSGGALTFVSVGSCTINADQVGDGSFLAAAQVSQTFAVNAVVPGAPTIGTATAGNGQATVSFTAPASPGGATITGYTVTSSPGGLTGTGTSSPITVTGLTNGTAYTFTVTATNSVGTGGASVASNAVTPIAVPVTGICGSAHGVAVLTAPSMNLCSPGTASSVTSAAATFAWDCAGSNGGTTAQCSALRQYQVTASAGANGSIAPAGVQTVAYNAVPNFTVTPAVLYRIDSVSGCGGTLVGSTYTTGAVAAHCTVSASFALIAHAITATAQPSAGGTVSCTPSSVGEGSSAACTTVANAGYVFQKWTGACAGQAAACSLTNVNAPQTSAALFQQEKTGLTVPQGAQQGQGLGLVLEPSVNNWVIQNASTATVASTGTSAPSGVNLPHGLVNLTLVTGTAGTSASVVLTYPQALPAGTKYYKFGKTAANPVDHWYEFSGAVISGNTITLTIVDGGEGDNDLTVNSVIDDPGGPAVVAAPPPPPPPPPSLVRLQVTVSGTGTVQRSVTGSVVGVLGSSTTVEYSEDQSVTLTPQPEPGARFSGWMGACSGLLPCTLTLRSNETVQATFSTVPVTTCRARAFSADEERVLAAYLAYYGRPADVGGLAYWVTDLTNERRYVGGTIDAFGRSQEFQQRFGQMAGEQLIANIYQQMYGREPDAVGTVFYTAKLASGIYSLASIAMNILDGTEGSDRLVLDNRQKVARYFVTRAEELGRAAPDIHDGNVLAGLVSDVGSDATSASAACARVDRLLDAAAGQ